MLRKIRISLAVIFIIGITLLFLDFTGTMHHWLGWMARIQFLPAVLALNLVTIAVLVLLTIVFGRVYCSVICPLGVYQDGVSNLSTRRKGKKARFAYSKEKKVLRYGVLMLFVIALIAGLNSLVALVAPYSAWGRIVQNLFAPFWQWGNNFLAAIAEKHESYAFYSKEVWIKSLPTLIVAAVTLVVVTVLAWMNGRTWCNTICPVGTTLSFFSRFAMFRPSIDASKCKNCRLCEKKCKASCIDVAAKTIDYSRCVSCFDCIDSCKFGSLKYRFAWKSSKSNSSQTEASNADKGRRAFLVGSTVALTGLSLNAQSATDAAEGVDDKKRDGGFAEVLPKVSPERTVPLTPFGSDSVKQFYTRCTACQLCVTVCPNDVLRPSKSLEHFMQPEMSFDKGYCRPECVKCSEVCPAGAILKITPEEKTAIKIGTAHIDLSLCVPNTKDVECGNCARHCPVGAISMVRKNPDDKKSIRIPAVNEERCIGCGACENLCPSRPLSAITVDGCLVHHKD
jgi:Polyferredoxin